MFPAETKPVFTPMEVLTCFSFTRVDEMLEGVDVQLLLNGCVKTLLAVVALGDGHAKVGHDDVPFVFIDIALVAGDDLGGRCEIGPQQARQLLGRHPLRDLTKALHG